MTNKLYDNESLLVMFVDLATNQFVCVNLAL